MLMTSTMETNLTAKILKQGHGHHNLLKFFLTSITDTQTLLLNAILVLKLICNRVIVKLKAYLHSVATRYSKVAVSTHYGVVESLLSFCSCKLQYSCHSYKLRIYYI